MTADSPLIDAIRRAVETDHDNVTLRLHFADLLRGAGNAEEAMRECWLVLAQDPTNAQALKLSSEAAALMRGSELIRSGEGERQPVPLHVLDGRERFAGSADPEPVTITLDDVAGLEHVKRRLNLAFLAPIRNPEIRKLYGKTLRGGLMLYGPPGCGKTFIARAVAGELGARFVSVGLSEVLDMWLGGSEKNLHEIFDSARQAAPAVLFFDEIDALGRKRTLLRQSAERNLVNQLLAEMDGAGSANDGLFILAATNHPWDVDSALRRPGRFDRTVLVLPPDRAARESLFQNHLRLRPTSGIDLAWLAAQTDEYSGADIAHVCDTAAEMAMDDSITSGTARPINQRDLRAALAEVKSSVRSWFVTARAFAEASGEDSTYGEVLQYIKGRRI